LPELNRTIRLEIVERDVAAEFVGRLVDHHQRQSGIGALRRVDGELVLVVTGG
jgi:hypothetical protein